MKKSQILLIFIFISITCFGQDVEVKKTFKERSKIRLKKIVKNGTDLFYYPKDTKKSQKIDQDFLDAKNLNGWYKANLTVKGDSILIYPWLFSSQKNDSKTKNLNTFFENNDIYLKMKDRVNYSFKHKSYNLQVVTLPVKWYMSSELGNIETDINAMLNIGLNKGSEHFVKFPHEEKTRHYKKMHSYNLLLGISKIGINASNREEDSLVEGNVAAFSFAVAYGFHFGKFSTLLAIGYDTPLSNRSDWKFSKVPFLGLGFGYDFLTF